jgi:acylphosphatase
VSAGEPAGKTREPAALMPLARVYCIVHGRVQGVAFRASTQRQARSLDLTGWVRNCHNGTVEVLAEGAPANVQRLVDWCHQGPPGAQVTRVEVSWEEAAGNLPCFEIRYF